MSGSRQTSVPSPFSFFEEIAENIPTLRAKAMGCCARLWRSTRHPGFGQFVQQTGHAGQDGIDRSGPQTPEEQHMGGS